MTSTSSTSVFHSRLHSLMNSFLVYETPHAQNAALAVTPLEDLKMIAQAKYDSCQKSESTTSVRDLLLLELLQWFKSDFFSWMDSPPCPLCSAKKTSPLGTSPPTVEETAKSASRVETFTCDKCFPTTDLKPVVARFPRYNNPVILLETRVGRCGEWANAFALICRASGFETRHVTDWTDHVWVEIWSEAKDTWVHADPCENSWDNPLMYEVGWGKKLSYVVAVSQDDIQDVTWRYTHSRGHPDVLKRRTEVNEVWLVKTLIEMRKERRGWIGLKPGRRDVLQLRLVKELVSFLSPTRKEVKDEEKVGRGSGDLAWRVRRGETVPGEEPMRSWCLEFNSAGSKPPPKELEFILEYCPVKDAYIWTNSGIGDKGPRTHVASLGHWQKGAYTFHNMVHKEERDWEMVYLARDDAGKAGEISWRFSSHGSARINGLELKLTSAAFSPQAKVSVFVSNSEEQVNFQIPDCDKDGTWKFIKTGLSCDWILVTCVLEGGSNWQDAQLFRKPIQGDPNVPFSIKVTAFQED